MTQNAPVARNVLLLGGTSEGRRLATVLAAEAGVRVVTSLAGRVSDPILPDGEVRIGGFGGPAGLADWLRTRHIHALVDATHPFAVGITASAAAASRDSGVALLRLQRPEWVAGPGDRWIQVPSLERASTALGDLGERVFLTTGRQGLAAFAGLAAHWFLVRSVNPPDPPVPDRMLALLDRGPFTVDGELALMHEHGIQVVVSKNSGGNMAAAKLVAAHDLGLPVVMVNRPPQPDVPTVTSVDEVVAWVKELA